MIHKKTWDEFKETGFLLTINQILQIFGWSIVFEMENGKVVDAFPARVKFRGFDDNSISDSYKKVSKYMLDNAKELNEEANE